MKKYWSFLAVLFVMVMLCAGTAFANETCEYATDGTAFEKESDRDAWNKKLKEQKSTEKVYYIADDGTYFETEKDMNDWNNYLKSQKADAVQKNAYSSRQEEIYLLKW